MQKFDTHKLRYYTAKRRLASLLFLFMTVAVAMAQHPILHNYTPSEYSGGTQNWSVAQDHDGCMMFGNNYGMLCFDGRHWDLFTVPNYTAVRAIYYATASHRTYVGASDEFGYFDHAPATGQLTYHSLSQSLPEHDRLSGEIWNIFECSGYVVMQSKNHLYRIDRDDRVTAIRMPRRIETATAFGDRVVAAGRDGVWTLSPSGKVKALASATQALQGMTVRQIVEMDGQLVFATAQHGLFTWQPKTDIVAPLTLDITPYLIANQIFCATARRGQLAIGTISGGLVVKDFTTGHTIYANTESGLTVNTVLGVNYDNNGNLWMALNNGICFLRSHTSAIGLTSTIGGIGTGYTSIREGNLLFLGTNQGLYTLPYPLVASPTPAEPHLVAGMTGQVWALNHTAGMLMACTDNGLYEITGGKPHHIEGLEGTWNIIELPAPSPVAQAASAAASQRLLACDYQGFAVLERRGSHFVLLHRVEGIDLVSGNFVLDPDGSLWVAHWQKGVYHFTLDRDYRRVRKTEHFGAGNGLATDGGSVLVTIGGRNYISAVGGIFAYDAKHHELQRAEQLQRLFHVWDPAPRLETPSGDIFAVNKNYLALARRQKGGAGQKTESRSYEVDHVSYSEFVHSLQFGIGTMGFADASHTILNTNDGFLLVNHNYHAT